MQPKNPSSTSIFRVRDTLVFMNQTTLFATAAILGAFYVAGQHIAAEPARDVDRMITVQATGKSTVTPNIAHITLGVSVQGQSTAAQATDTLGKKINDVIKALKDAGIADADIATQNVSVNPAYDYTDGRQVPKGFDANEQVDVKIRKTDTVGDIISKVTAVGANQVGGVQFTSDDADAVQLAAEKDAINNANKKAQDIANALHVSLGKVKTYSVNPGIQPMPYAMDAKAVGAGSAPTAPDVPVGSQDTTVSVSVTYDIR